MKPFLRISGTSPKGGFACFTAKKNEYQDSINPVTKSLGYGTMLLEIILLSLLMNLTFLKQALSR